MKSPKVFSDRLVHEFADRHGLELSDLVRREGVAICAASAATTAINQSYAALDDNRLNDAAVGVLLNMLHRNFEHVEGAIVAFVTGCGSSAEVIARASVESSVTLLYILSGQRTARLAGWFNHYLDHVDAVVRRWFAEANDLGGLEAAAHERAAKQRRESNDVMRRFATALMQTAGEPWPKQVSERFKGVGESMAYKTVYARMSSEGHADAEKTLRFAFGTVHHDPDVIAAMALETVWNTRLYIYYAASLFLRACRAYAGAFSLSAVRGTVGIAIAKVEAELAEIVLHVGGCAAVTGLVNGHGN